MSEDHLADIQFAKNAIGPATQLAAAFEYDMSPDCVDVLLLCNNDLYVYRILSLHVAET